MLLNNVKIVCQCMWKWCKWVDESKLSYLPIYVYKSFIGILCILKLEQSAEKILSEMHMTTSKQSHQPIDKKRIAEENTAVDGYDLQHKNKDHIIYSQKKWEWCVARWRVKKIHICSQFNATYSVSFNFMLISYFNVFQSIFLLPVCEKHKIRESSSGLRGIDWCHGS